MRFSIKQTVLACVETLLNLILNHTLATLTLLFALGVGVTLWYVERLSNEQVRETALDHARLYTEALAEFRTLYTSEVVVAAKEFGIEVTHDYKTKEGAIPLPVTLSMLLGNRLGDKRHGAKSLLYSEYPFPWRESTGGLTNDFAREAWALFQKDPEQTYSRFEEIEGHLSLRYATADVMRPSCVNCHNTHPDTPKNDWKVGDVRGVLELITPIDDQMALANDSLRQSFILISSILILSLVIIAGVLTMLHKRTDEARAYAEATEQTNKELAEEIEVRKQAEKKLREIAQIDSLTGIDTEGKDY